MPIPRHSPCCTRSTKAWSPCSATANSTASSARNCSSTGWAASMPSRRPLPRLLPRHRAAPPTRWWTRSCSRWRAVHQRRRPWRRNPPWRWTTKRTWPGSTLRRPARWRPWKRPRHPIPTTFSIPRPSSRSPTRSPTTSSRKSSASARRSPPPWPPVTRRSASTKSSLPPPWTHRPWTRSRNSSTSSSPTRRQRRWARRPRPAPEGRRRTKSPSPTTRCLPALTTSSPRRTRKRTAEACLQRRRKRRRAGNRRLPWPMRTRKRHRLPWPMRTGKNRLPPWPMQRKREGSARMPRWPTLMNPPWRTWKRSWSSSLARANRKRRAPRRARPR